MPSTAEIIKPLRRAGWSLGDTAFHTVGGRLVWVVSGTNSENRIRAEGATSVEAWRGAAEQARLMGMLGTEQSGACSSESWAEVSPWREGTGRLIIGFEVSDMIRATQFTIGQCMIAIATIGYFCAFPELAVLLGIFVSALLFVSPVFVVSYLALRFLLWSTGPGRGSALRR
jgi:hypothetical protein